MRRFLYTAVLACLVSFTARPASASGFQVGDLTTFTQADWGGDPGTDAGATALVASYETVYMPTFGIVTVGSTAGFTMRFTDASSVLAYEPSVGPFNPLNGPTLDPITTASGGFGGEVLGLEFNVDFNDANVLPHTLNVRFGDLVMANFAAGSPFNALTVRQFLGDVNDLLGGLTSAFTIADLGSTVGDLNASFTEGNPSAFTQAHLIAPAEIASVPEPATVALLGTGLLGCAMHRRFGRRRR
jgi:hypothetical protein